MGLDITVQRLKKVLPPGGDVHFITLDTELKKEFKKHGLDKFNTYKQNAYYDFKKYFKSIGRNIKDFRNAGACWGPETYFDFYDTKHPLYKIIKRLSEKYNGYIFDVVLDNPFTIKDLFTKKELELLNEYGLQEKLNKENAISRECSRFNEDEQQRYCVGMIMFDILHETIFRVFEESIPTYTKRNTVVYWVEEGYQRKGLNAKFYQDYRDGKIGYFVYTLDELKRYKEEYCVTEEDFDYKEHFQKQIIDKFKEGECVVSFDW
jgi:hypothetical protein